MLKTTLPKKPLTMKRSTYKMMGGLADNMNVANMISVGSLVMSVLGFIQTALEAASFSDSLNNEKEAREQADSEIINSQNELIKTVENVNDHAESQIEQLTKALNTVVELVQTTDEGTKKSLENHSDVIKQLLNHVNSQDKTLYTILENLNEQDGDIEELYVAVEKFAKAINNTARKKVVQDSEVPKRRRKRKSHYEQNEAKRKRKSQEANTEVK